MSDVQPGPRDIPASAASEKKDFASTHRVKKLLETYTMTADRSLMGPDASDHKFYAAAAAAASSYKLPPDVELSKTGPSSAESGGIPSAAGVKIDLAATKRLQAMHGGGGLKGGALSPPPPPPVHQHHQPPTSSHNGLGLVTLSRMDGNGYDPELAARQRARSGSDLGGGGRPLSSQLHLTGEMIRQMNAVPNAKKPASSATSASVAAAAAAASLAYQQQIQMQAVYERALKEKSYLKYNKVHHSSSHEAGSGGPPSATFKSPAASASATSASAAATTMAPVFSSRDRGQADLSETRLAAREIACFEVGGEKRCCLPQILNSVLDQISLQAIHAACDELQIYCSTCTPEQLEVLKLAKIIPITASQCGLITKSDAERLCSMLLDRSPPVASASGFNAMASPFSFRVQHECFGKCRGIVLPEAYTSATAKCIECLECEGLFCPPKFVCHSHRNKENRTCHWGFDSANWRAYLHLADDYTKSEKDKMSKTVSDFKSRYSTTPTQNHHKRKQTDSMVYPHHNGGRDRSLEDKSPRGGHDGLGKKARLDSADLANPNPAMLNADAYGFYLYQSWATAAASGKPQPPMHPAAAAAAAAAFTAHYNQAIKEGKPPPIPPPGFMPPPSSAGHNGGGYHRGSGGATGSSGYEAKPSLTSPHQSHHGHAQHQISPSESRSHHHVLASAAASGGHHRVKSSPMSDNGGVSPSERLSHSYESSATSPGDYVSVSTQLRRSRPSSSSLAEDIMNIKAALDGASVTARERTLKTLERLTARLAYAESERDMAIEHLKQLQKKYERTEDELGKKRAELREALRNDGSGSQVSPHLPPPTSGQRESSRSAAGGVSLEPIGDDDPFSSASVTASKRVEYLSKKYGSMTSVGLPKMDIKSPARVIEEKERSCGGSSRSSRSSQPTGSPPSSTAMLSSTAHNVDTESPHTNDSLPMRTALRRRSGTPASVRSRESEDLRERMMTMEAELRALRDELSTRSSAKAAAASASSNKEGFEASVVNEVDADDDRDGLDQPPLRIASPPPEDQVEESAKPPNGNGNGNGTGDEHYDDNNDKVVVPDKKTNQEEGDTNSNQKQKEDDKTDKDVGEPSAKKAKVEAAPPTAPASETKSGEEVNAKKENNIKNDDKTKPETEVKDSSDKK